MDTNIGYLEDKCLCGHYWDDRDSRVSANGTRSRETFKCPECGLRQQVTWWYGEIVWIYICWQSEKVYGRYEIE